ncbi:hypothetical protein F5141DRAFT_1075440 [Pisolithus sp. B1]|nr:hypothetical protein F5141DRAFT_1075440 [Pisolithus sp. B1]
MQDDNILPQDKPEPIGPSQQDKICRICFDGEDPALGRLIKPCLCTGSISYVHVKCLQRWRTQSSGDNAFYRCPQCRFHYRFARTKVVGLATNPLAVGVLSSFLFTILVMCSSFITTYFLSYIEDQSTFGSTYFFISPIDVGQDLMRAAIRILRDQDFLTTEDYPIPLNPRVTLRPPETPGLLKRFLRRFVLGLPMIGAGSLIHMLFSMPVLAPLQWVARWRGNRSRRGSSRDMAAAIIVAFIVIGALRALYKVYCLTRKMTERLLLYAENVILEVN